MRPAELTAGDPFVLIEDAAQARTLCFRDPDRLVIARTPGEVGSALAQLREAQRAGYHLAGFVAYEAGYAFEARLARLAPPTATPLLVFGLFREPETLDWAAGAPEAGWLGPLEPSWSRRDYADRFDRVIGLIRAGDVYQVNLTMPMQGRWRGDPVGLYADLRRRQPGRHGALVSLGGALLLSFSPELFFETDAARRIRVRPMKGTAARGRAADEDERLARGLAGSPKDRAENLMIVDLLRNDLGRIAAVGSVAVTDLYTVERYPTLLQMTSGIEARLRDDVDLPAVFAALFPCGSVTGAPKIRAMEVIRGLEDGPRGAYCGSIGHVRPDGTARFNVAIRTATLWPDGAAVFPVGSGVVFDSGAEAEYDECLLKARFLTEATRPSA